MIGRRNARALPRASMLLVPLALALLAACDGGPAAQAAMAPPGSTPDQIRFFCTQESDRAAAFVGFPPNYVEERLRAANAAFASCMARHNIRP